MVPASNSFKAYGYCIHYRLGLCLMCQLGSAIWFLGSLDSEIEDGWGDGPEHGIDTVKFSAF